MNYENFKDCYADFKRSLTDYLNEKRSDSSLIFLKPALQFTQADFFIERRALEIYDDEVTEMKHKSNEWSLNLDHVTIMNNSILFYICRKNAFERGLSTIFHHPENLYGSTNTYKSKIFVLMLKELFIDYDLPSENNLSSYRLNVMACAIQKISQSVGYKIVSRATDGCLKLYLCNNVPNVELKNYVTILCCKVVNSKTKCKEMDLTTAQYKRFLMQQFLSNEGSNSNSICDKLADATAKFNMLSIKSTNTVSVSPSYSEDTNPFSVVFILYNYTRMNALLCKFEDRVRNGYYPSLPPVSQIEFGLLNSEKEWKIMLHYILKFPSTVLQTAENLEYGKFDAHRLCKFLYNLSCEFSSYYRSSRILLDHCVHLLPLLFARIYFIKAIKLVIHNCFRMLEIEPFLLCEDRS